MKITRGSFFVIGCLAMALGAGCNGIGFDDDDIRPDATEDVNFPPMGAGVSTLAGADTPGHVDGPRGTNRFFNPVNVSVANGGDVFVSDFDNSLIRRVSPEGDADTVFAADPNFFRPFGLTFIDDNTLLVQTDYNGQAERGGALWRVDLANGTNELLLDNVGRPRGLARISTNEILMVEYQQHLVQVLSLSDKSVRTIAGAEGLAGFADGAGEQARFNIPYDAVVMPNGNFLVSDQLNHRLREVTPAGQVTTFAGTGTPATEDGTRMSASFNEPQGLAIDDGGNVYVSERSGYVIRKIDPAGNVSTVAGSGRAGWHDSEDALEAEFWGLEGIDVTRDGSYLYISDGSRGEADPHHYVRRLQLN